MIIYDYIIIIIITIIIIIIIVKLNWIQGRTARGVTDRVRSDTMVCPIWHDGLGTKEVFWCWTLSWPKGATTNRCWICSPNIRIIGTSRWFTCVTTCFRVNMLSSSTVKRITPWSSLAINWVWRIYYYKRFLIDGKTWWRSLTEPRVVKLGTCDLHPASDDRMRVFDDLLHKAGITTENGLETKISLDFQYFILNEHVYRLFFMP